MGLVVTESRQEGHKGVTLAQLNALCEQATREAIGRGIDPDQVEPKVTIAFGGAVKAINIQIG